MTRKSLENRHEGVRKAVFPGFLGESFEVVVQLPSSVKVLVAVGNVERKQDTGRG